MAATRADYNEFLRSLRRVLCAVSTHRAPAGLPERVMRRLGDEAEPRTVPWTVRPAAAFAGALAAFLLGVWQPWKGPVPEPKILSFTADKTIVNASEPVTLHWKVLNAQRVVIERINVESKAPDQAVAGAYVTDKGSSSVTLHLTKPGKYSFVLMAMGGRGESVEQALAN